MGPLYRSPRILLSALSAGVLAVAGCGGKDSGGPTVTTTSAVAAAAGSGQQPGGSRGGAPQPAPAAGDVQSAFIKVIEDVSPQVVLIETGEGLGSGVVYDGRGNIVTNAHVVGRSKAFTVTLAKGDRHKAKLVGSYPPADLAVIRLSSGGAPVATFADSSKARVGELVLAIGNPLGLRSSVTNGIISSLGRTVSEGQGAAIPSAIQTSAPINPGNSGGALVDLAGQVVGIPTLAATDPQLGGGQAPGIGFAIPSNTVKQIASQLVSTGHVTRSGRAFLGVQVASAVSAPGVVVASAERGGPAAKAGIRDGDVIVAINGKPTPTADDLTTTLADLQPGQTVPVTIARSGGKRSTVRVRLGENPG